MNRVGRNFLLDNMYSQAAYWAASGTVIASLTSYYALSLPLSNLLTGFTSTLLIIQLFGGAAYTGTKNRPAFVRGFNILWRCCLPLTFLSVLLPREIGGWAMAVCYFIAVASSQFVSPAQTEWTVTSTAGHTKNNYFSMREMTFMLGYSAIFCGFNLALNIAQKTDAMRAAFCVIGVLLAVILGVSVVTLFRLPPPEQRPPERSGSRTIWRNIWKNKPFLHVTSTYSMWFFACMFIGTFGNLYQIRILHLSFAQIMLWATVGNLARAALTPVMGRLAARVGWKNTIMVSMVLMLAAALCWFFVRPSNALWMFPLVSILAALPYAGMNVGILQLQVDTTPAETRSVYFSANAVGNGVAAFLGTTLCSAFIGGVEAAAGAASGDYLRYAFLIGAAGVGVTMVLSRFIPEKRREDGNG
ncbi:MAG: MFS transporter [Oscillospiraceae bacterium]